VILGQRTLYDRERAHQVTCHKTAKQRIPNKLIRKAKGMDRLLPVRQIDG